MIVVIDGPAGSGKSSTARLVAQSTGYIMMDSGMMYRGMALAFLEAVIPLTEKAAQDLFPFVHLEVTVSGARMALRLNGKDISALLRSSEISAMSSKLATMKSVRQFLLPLQQGLALRYGKRPGLVGDGRDLGTVVFPQADLKFFLTASVHIRAQRRLAELQQKGENITLEVVKNALVARDKQDSGRSFAPLRQAADAIPINGDSITLDEQVALILQHVREQSNKNSR